MSNSDPPHSIRSEVYKGMSERERAFFGVEFFGVEFFGVEFFGYRVF